MMPRVTFITADGREMVVARAAGTLMEAALDHGVPGIDAECSGVGSCGTCHVHVAAPWLERVGPASASERDVLELHPHVASCSRLACQVVLSPEHDGLIVRVPPRG
jgi:ferredoxin, 2Fe-2S